MNQLDDDIAVAEGVLRHFPKAAEGDVALIRGLMPTFSAASILGALERHREALGATAYRPDVAKLRAMLTQGHAERTSEGVRMTDVYRQAERSWSGSCRAEYERADELIAGYDAESIKPLVVEFMGELRTGMLTLDPLGRPDPATGAYLADLYRRKPTTRGFRLKLAEWLRRRAA